MTPVIDASVAIKWVVAEAGTPAALALRRQARGLLAVRCANILWKKAQRGEMSAEEARVAAAILARAEITLLPAHPFAGAALDLALRLGHPAHDCACLALAAARGLPFVTADLRLLRRLEAARAAGTAGLPETLALAP